MVKDTFDNTLKIITVPRISFHSIFFAFALYLSFKLNNGFQITSFIAAMIFPYIYIPYVLWKHGVDIIWKGSIHNEKLS